jgi:hypothetical protein
MQTLYKFLVVPSIALLWGCGDALEIVPDDSGTTPVNSLTIAVQDPDEPTFSGTYALQVTGPKDFISTQSKQTVRLENLPPGEYTVSILKEGHLPFEKQVRVISSAEKEVEQRYRVDALLAKRGKPFRFSNATGAHALFPSGTAATAQTPFPEARGISRYNSVRLALQPCSIEGADCLGEVQLSASIVPMHTELLSGAPSSAQIGLFLLDLEADKPYLLSKPLNVEFPVKLDSDPFLNLSYRMVRMEKDPVSGRLKFSGESVPVSVHPDGSRGSAQLPNVNADWMFVVQAKWESSAAPTGFSPVAKSLKPGKSLSAQVSLGTALDPLLADLLGLTNPEVVLQEAIMVSPARNKTAEVSVSVLVRTLSIRNPATNEVLFIVNDMPNYPVGIKTTSVIPHDSGGA